MKRYEMEDRPPLPGAGRVEDYTVPFLWAAGMLTFIALFAIWAAYGLPIALAAGYIADRVVQRFTNSDEA